MYIAAVSCPEKKKSDEEIVVLIIVYMKLIVMSRIPWIDERETETETETERQIERREALVEFLLHLGDERVYSI